MGGKETFDENNMLDTDKSIKITQIINSLHNFKCTHYIEEYRQLQELENSHMTFKGIPISGSIEQISQQFLKIGDFKHTNKYGAHLCGTLFGLPTVYLKFIHSVIYGNVTEIMFLIYDGELSLLYDAFKESLQSKYASATISVSEDLKKPFVLIYPETGCIYLCKYDDHIQISYTDELKIYDKIKKIKESLWIKQKLAREQRLKNRLMIGINIDL